MVTLPDCWEMLTKHSWPRSGKIPVFAMSCVNWLIEGTLQTLREAHMDFLHTLSISAVDSIKYCSQTSCTRFSPTLLLGNFSKGSQNCEEAQPLYLLYPSVNTSPHSYNGMIELHLLFSMHGPKNKTCLFE